MNPIEYNEALTVYLLGKCVGTINSNDGGSVNSSCVTNNNGVYNVTATGMFPHTFSAHDITRQLAFGGALLTAYCQLHGLTCTDELYANDVRLINGLLADGSITGNELQQFYVEALTLLEDKVLLPEFITRFPDKAHINFGVHDMPLAINNKLPITDGRIILFREELVAV